jgi:hypothetical protein
MASEQRMTHPHLGQRVALDKPLELLPGEGCTLTASIEPLEEDADGFPHELSHRYAVEGHAIVLDMSA